MRDFKFLSNDNERTVISQNEYNRRRDMMAQQEYQRNFYEQMRVLDDLLEEQRSMSIKKYKIKKIDLFFDKLGKLFYTKEHRKVYDKIYSYFLISLFAFIFIYIIYKSI